MEFLLTTPGVGTLDGRYSLNGPESTIPTNGEVLYAVLSLSMPDRTLPIPAITRYDLFHYNNLGVLIGSATATLDLSAASLPLTDAAIATAMQAALDATGIGAPWSVQANTPTTNYYTFTATVAGANTITLTFGGQSVAAVFGFAQNVVYPLTATTSQVSPTPSNRNPISSLYLAWNGLHGGSRTHPPGFHIPQLAFGSTGTTLVFNWQPPIQLKGRHQTQHTLQMFASYIGNDTILPFFPAGGFSLTVRMEEVQSLKTPEPGRQGRQWITEALALPATPKFFVTGVPHGQLLGVTSDFRRTQDMATKERDALGTESQSLLTE